jgi:hypothetical protein
MADLFKSEPEDPSAARPRLRTIPEIRQRLKQLAKFHGLPELAQLADETRRRSARRQARPHRRRITDDLKAQVSAYAAAHPTEALDLIGERFNIDGGRVSEILHGKRGTQ